MPPGVLQVMPVGCDSLADAGPQALGLTYWFDATPDGEPYAMTVRFAGQRVGVKRKPRRQDHFTATETVESVVPGSGTLAITTRISGINPGEWRVTATPVTQPDVRAAGPRSRARQRSSAAKTSSSGRTGPAQVMNVRAPGVRIGAWPVLVACGVAAALTVQALLAARHQLPVTTTLLISLIASIVGLAGAKVYYVAQHTPRSLLSARAVLKAGMCIQGFVLAAMSTAAIGLLVMDIPVGRFLAVTAPGLLFGMALGRLGCFFGGCCAGRLTASRWGLWSSDRHLGARRIPTQLLESSFACAVASIALILVLVTDGHPAATVFIGGIAAYTLGRQLLFPLRDIPRKTSHGRAIVMAVTALVLLADVGVAVAS